MFLTVIIFVCILLPNLHCKSRIGPDPWDEAYKDENILEDDDLPSDLRIPKPVVKVKPEINQGMSDWFYKRLLAIILKGGQKKENDDSTIDVSLQMKYSQEQLNILYEYIASNNALTEDMFRRSVGYIEESIYKPTITEKIALAWSEYVYIYFIEYKEYITWGFSIAAFVGTTFWLWFYISYKHIFILIGIGLYLYEVLISYKEAEKKEVDRFLLAINTCKWFFWTSNCEVAPPDPLIMLKHMNPLKIAVRMFTTIISEPMITISDTVNTMLLSITGDLMYPLNKIAQVTLVLIFNALLIMLLVSIVFNFILNIPIQLNFFSILSIGIKQRQRSSINPVPSVDTSNQGDRITGETLNRILDIFHKTLNVAQSPNSRNSQNLAILNSSQGSSMKRSASTGRLPNLISSFTNNLQKDGNIVKRKHGGSGDTK